MNSMFSYGQSILQMPPNMHSILLGQLPSTLNQPAGITPSVRPTLTNNCTNASVPELASRHFNG